MFIALGYSVNSKPYGFIKRARPWEVDSTWLEENWRVVGIGVLDSVGIAGEEVAELELTQRKSREPTSTTECTLEE